jgi:hypothetical protein
MAVVSMASDVVGQSAAGGAFTTASTTITMGGAKPSWFTNGRLYQIWDVTPTGGAYVGASSSWSGTTLTLNAASLINSDGAADNLVFIAAQSAVQWYSNFTTADLAALMAKTKYQGTYAPTAFQPLVMVNQGLLSFPTRGGPIKLHQGDWLMVDPVTGELFFFNTTTGAGASWKQL